jgi:hypothetical protein
MSKKEETPEVSVNWVKLIGFTIGFIALIVFFIIKVVK